MNRRDLIRHLKKHGCEVIREGGKHSIVQNEKTRMTIAVPRHNEIDRITAIKVCDRLEIPRPPGN